MRRFQASRGLRVDGVCGRQTWSALIEAGWRLGNRLLYRRTPMLRGEDVAELQRRLGELGFDAGRVDGIFGDTTARALADFQRNLGITVDGICGPSTVAALQRLTPRTGGGSVAEIRERYLLGGGSVAGLEGRRVALGQRGGLDALVAVVTKALGGAGAEVITIWDTDGSAQAVEANAAGAHAFVGFDVVTDHDGCQTSYYAGFRYESPAGRRLADLLQPAVAATLGIADLGVRGMSLPVLRETRMPAVLCEFGPPAAVVQRAADLGPVVRDALARWMTQPGG